MEKTAARDSAESSTSARSAPFANPSPRSPAGQRQSVAVAKAVMSQAQLVIMDEPTAALGVAQTRDGARASSRRSPAGEWRCCVISHNLIDVFEVSDQIACLYLGQLAVQGPASAFNTQNLVEYMTTGTASQPIDRAAAAPAAQEASAMSATEDPPGAHTDPESSASAATAVAEDPTVAHRRRRDGARRRS